MTSKIIGVNTRSIPRGEVYADYKGDMNYHVGRVNYKVVLVEGDIGDYAAYMGVGDDEFVAHQGDKLSFNEARIHFPGLEKEKYRE